MLLQSILIHSHSQYEFQELIRDEWVAPKERPAWGDLSRTLEVTKQDLHESPDGWKWADDWDVDREMLAATSNEHVDELLQVERRDLGRVDWAHDPSAQFLDEQHRPVRSLDDYLNAAPSGWEWVRSSDNCFSTIDMERCCDNEGWTYGLESHLSAASAYFSDTSVYADRDAVAAAEAAGGIKAALEQVERERDWLSVINSPFERPEHTVRIRRVLLLRRRVDIQESSSLEACLVFPCAVPSPSAHLYFPLEIFLSH